jgi:hypothetical protein
MPTMIHGREPTPTRNCTNGFFSTLVSDKDSSCARERAAQLKMRGIEPKEGAVLTSEQEEAMKRHR